MKQRINKIIRNIGYNAKTFETAPLKNPAPKQPPQGRNSHRGCISTLPPHSAHKGAYWSSGANNTPSTQRNYHLFLTFDVESIGRFELDMYALGEDVNIALLSSFFTDILSTSSTKEP